MGKYAINGGRKTWRRIILSLIVVILLVAVGGMLTVRRAYTSNLKPISASQKVQLFTVANGATVQEIGADLESQGLIRKAWAFEAYVRTQNLRDKLQAGTYALRPNQTTQEIVTVLTQGQVATDSVTILPAQRLDQIRKVLISSGYSADSVDTALDPSLYTDHPALADKPRDASLEGYLFPETFQKTADTKPETIIRASLDQMQKQLTPELREGIVRQGLTVHQGVIIASIVEQEVSNPEDKPIVAQVFLKRLREGIQLGSDVTSIYGAIVGGHPEYSIAESIGFDSPYNTRIRSGMPPGPISNSGSLSLQAVAKPAQTNFLFFVAGDDGKTYYSNTDAEHQENVRKHCIKLCSL